MKEQGMDAEGAKEEALLSCGNSVAETTFPPLENGMDPDFASVVEGVNALVCVVDPQSYQILFANRRLRDETSCSEAGGLCYQSFDGENHTPCPNCPILNSGSEASAHEIYYKKCNRWYSFESHYIQQESGSSAVVCTGHDITKTKQRLEKLSTLAFTDTQVNVLNRIAYAEEMQRRYRESATGCVLGVDLRNFKDYNLTFGKQKGDSILQSIANYFGTMEENTSVYRVAGVKFAFILDSVEHAQRLIIKIRKRFERKWETHTAAFQIDPAFVLVEFPRYGETVEELAANFEYIFMELKNHTANDLLIFNDSMKSVLTRKEKIKSAIERAIKNDLFQVHYQPVYSISGDCFDKCEALVRLWDEELGNISPGEFIPIAEESGLISEVGMLVLRRVCSKIAQDQKNGVNDIIYNVNVSTIQFAQPNFVNRVISVVDEHGIDPSSLMFEVTETIMISSLDYMTEIMGRFIDYGIRFCIDDFGSGYSGLNYLASLPIVGVKIDKSFIDKIVDSSTYGLIIKNIIEIAQGLNLSVVAEGVERKDQIQILDSLGCDYIQGFYYSRPLNEQDFDAFVGINQ